MRWICPAILFAIAAQAQPRAAIEQYIASHQQQIVRELVELLAIPNVAADHANIRRNTVALAAMLGKRGFHTEILETAGNPLVYGEKAGRAPTVLHSLRRPAGGPVEVEAG
jgi:hypothetical protein